MNVAHFTCFTVDHLLIDVEELPSNSFRRIVSFIKSKHGGFQFKDEICTLHCLSSWLADAQSFVPKYYGQGFCRNKPLVGSFVIVPKDGHLVILTIACSEEYYLQETCTTKFPDE